MAWTINYDTGAMTISGALSATISPEVPEEAFGHDMINTNLLRKAMDEMAAKKSEFTLFALLKRPDAFCEWDLVVSAPWLGTGGLKVTREFVRMLTRSMGEGFLQQLSRVVALASDEPRVKFIRENLPFEKKKGELRVQSINLLGLQIEEAIILRAEKLTPSPAMAYAAESHAPLLARRG